MSTIKMFGNSLEFSHNCDTCAGDDIKLRHCHDEYEILFVVEGEGRYIIEGAEFNLKPRTLVLIKPFEYHCVEVDKSCVYERYVLHFDKSILSPESCSVLEKIADAFEGSSGIFYPSSAISDASVSVFSRFAHASLLAECESVAFSGLLLSELILLLSASEGINIIHSDDELGAYVIRYINKNLTRSVTLDALAKKFFISKFYLCRAFKEYSGVSIRSYINHKRVIYAKQLIESGMTAAAAAEQVGFSDYSTFYRAYVKILGAPPTLESRRRSSSKTINQCEEEPLS